MKFLKIRQTCPGSVRLRTVYPKFLIGFPPLQKGRILPVASIPSSLDSQWPAVVVLVRRAVDRGRQSRRRRRSVLRSVPRYHEPCPATAQRSRPTCWPAQYTPPAI